MAKRTQAQRMTKIAEDLEEHLGEIECGGGMLMGLRELRRQLDPIVAAAQNPPPLGARDSSVGSALWRAARDIEAAIRHLEEACDAFGDAKRREG